MSELYEKQEDGTLKPIDLPDAIAQKLSIYMILRNHGLSLDEIQYLLQTIWTC